jgi:hypothetical protein
MKTLEQIRERAEKLKSKKILIEDDKAVFGVVYANTDTAIQYAKDIERLVKAVEYLKEESTLTVQDKANKILEGIE